VNTTNAKKNETNNQTGLPFIEFADQAVKQYGQALQAGLKLQGEMAEQWTQTFNQPVGVQDWQKRFTQCVTMANKAVPVAQEHMQEVVQLMQKNIQTSTDLMKKAFEAAQTPAIAESQTKWIDFWNSSLGAVRGHSEALTQINTKAIDSCIGLVRKNGEAS
jgi:hypothetical protein